MSGSGNQASSGSSKAADPLASVITQVQPGQAAGGSAAFANRGGAGPAKPTRVAKSGTAKAAAQQTAQSTSTQAPAAGTGEPTAEQPRKKKKKRRTPRVPTEGQGGGAGDVATGTTEGEGAAGPAAAAAAAATSVSGTGSGNASSTDDSYVARAAPALTGAVYGLPAASAQGSQSASTVPATTPGAAGVGETDAAATMQETDPRRSTEQDMTEAAQKLQLSSQEEGQTSTAAAPASNATAGPSTTPPPAAAAADAPAPAPPSGTTTKATGSSATSPPSAKPAAATTPSTSAPARTAPTTASQQQQQKKKPSALKKIVAMLTCSSVTVDDGTGSSSAASTSRQPASKTGGNFELKEVPSAAKQREGGAASSATAGGAKTGRPGVNRADGSKASSSKQLQQQQQAQRDASKLSPPGKAALGVGAIGGAIGATTLATHHHGRPGSTSARNSLESRSETGVIAPPPGTITPGGGTQLPREETGDVMSGAVVPPGSSFVALGSGGSATPTPTPSRRGVASSQGDARNTSDEDSDEYTDDDDDDSESGTEDSEVPSGVLARGVTTPGQDDFINQDEEDVLSEEQRLIAQGGMGIPVDENGNPRPLLEPLAERDAGRKCLVLDLDETLVHSSFKMINNADFIVPVEIEGTVHNVYVIKRPGVDEFMRKMGLIYEVVVFTASLSKYADPVLDILDIHQVVRHRLFRESCYNHRGNYVKDLSQIGRPIEESIIIDNSPASYIFHPNNAVPISSWFNDPHDTELTDLCPFLADLSEVVDVRSVLDGGMTLV